MAIASMTQGDSADLPAQLFQDRAALADDANTEFIRAEIDRLENEILAPGRPYSVYIELAKRHSQLGQFGSANDVYREAIRAFGDSVVLFRAAFRSLAESNRMEEAFDLLRNALEQFPHEVPFRFKEGLTLPVVYRSCDEIHWYRDRFLSHIAALVSTLDLSDETTRRSALDAVGDQEVFYIAYQGIPNYELQQAYAHFAHRIVAENYPQWVQRVAIPPLGPTDRVRVGYVSECFYDHSITKACIGWITERDRSRTEVFCYHVGKRSDRVTDEVRRSSDVFRHPGPSMEETAKAIRADELHVLVFLNVGFNPLITQLAVLRLAAIQCGTMGSPITTGSPTIDYFISSELMEPPNGQSHYTERLVRLPGIGFAYRKPIIPKAVLTRRREYFGLAEERTIYLCCQSAFKYLPHYDRLLTGIAQRLRKAQFVFVIHNDLVRMDLSRRLSLAFAEAGLDAEAYCYFISRPIPSKFDYWNLNIVSDVLLDTPGFSGMISSMEGIACGLPVVTLPGETCRTRHTSGILRQAGVNETIAGDEEDYVRIAVRLATDTTWREGILARLNAAKANLFDDLRCVAALEEFYRQAVREKLELEVNGQVPPEIGPIP